VAFRTFGGHRLDGDAGMHKHSPYKKKPAAPLSRRLFENSDLSG